MPGNSIAEPPQGGGLIDRFIRWAVSNAKDHARVVTFDGKFLFDRFEFVREDEWPDHWWDKCKDAYAIRPNRLPWWQPVNAFLHCWNPEPGTTEGFHDHPRWSITICLRGRILERTPWGERMLKPGSIVIRSRKAIHAFAVPEGFAGQTWTLFIVGRRRYRQNTFVVTPR